MILDLLKEPKKSDIFSIDSPIASGFPRNSSAKSRAHDADFFITILSLWTTIEPLLTIMNHYKVVPPQWCERCFINHRNSSSIYLP